MNKTKILLDALHTIASQSIGPDWTKEQACDFMREHAREAILTFNSTKEYRITARTWFSRTGGGEYRAELREIGTGREVIEISGSASGLSSWESHMRDAMHERMPDVFPDAGRQCPTIYFREVCNVDYDAAEVARKRDL